ncbi:proteoglycan 4-like [Ruditapes philippinarum]|uniref:proteoglycan 4-like n=1 Tax=Ruditapes philippinarum TaxID=129788 RepID=UPI00295BEF1C|nr:proteoglycan 4-like [Ruditapes philippinarum]
MVENEFVELPEPLKTGSQVIVVDKPDVKDWGNLKSVEGYDVTITVTPNELFVQYSNDAKPEFSLPIRTLSICAAVRCVEDASGSSNMKFVPVHSVITAIEPDSDHPAIFSTVMRHTMEDDLQCHMFICNSTRDALHLVNATQTAHTAFTKGYNETGAMKFFIDRSSEFDRTLRLNQSNAEKRVDTRKIYMYQEDYDTRQYNADTKTYVTTVDNTSMKRTGRVSTRNYTDANITMDGNTYYVKASEVRSQTPPPVPESETVFIKSNVEHMRPPTPPPQQTIYVDKPIIKPAPPIEIPPPKIIERPVVIEPPPLPKMEQQIIYVDKPVFKEMHWPDPPAPKVVENEVFVDLPEPPKQDPQVIVVDKPVVRDWPQPPTPPAPIIQENPVYIDPPAWPERAPQKIIVDTPVMREIGPAPPAPPPIIEQREVYIDPPEYPEQKPHRIVVEKPCFNAPKPAPRPPTPIIETKNVYIDAPPYPKQEAQRIVVEKPIISDPGPPPPPPKPIIIEKPVEVPPPRWPKPEPQRIVVEKLVMRDPGPPPPQPDPIIIEKIVYVDPPPWPKVEPQRIVVEKPVFRPRPRPPVPKPIIIEKPVYVDMPEQPLPKPQTIVVEKPVLRKTYGVSETRQHPSAYNYHYQYRPTEMRGSYVVSRSQPQPRGLRRYAWSDAGGEDRYRSGWDYTTDAGGYRLYGQPRDFRTKQFMNERGFSRHINEEFRHTHRGPSSYTYGRREGSTSS